MRASAANGRRPSGAATIAALCATGDDAHRLFRNSLSKPWPTSPPPPQRSRSPASASRPKCAARSGTSTGTATPSWRRWSRGLPRARRGVRRGLRQLPARAHGRSRSPASTSPPTAVAHARERYVAAEPHVRRRVPSRSCRCLTRAWTSSCRSRRSSTSRSSGRCSRSSAACWRRPARSSFRRRTVPCTTRPVRSRTHFHVKELDRAELKALLDPVFPRQAWYAQRVIAQSALWSEDDEPAGPGTQFVTLAGDARARAARSRRAPMYFLVACAAAGAPLPALPALSLFDDGALALWRDYARALGREKALAWDELDARTIAAGPAHGAGRGGERRSRSARERADALAGRVASASKHRSRRRTPRSKREAVGASRVARAARLPRIRARLGPLAARGAEAAPLRRTAMIPVDVIVPVHRNLEATRRCIESILASACTDAVRAGRRQRRDAGTRARAVPARPEGAWPRDADRAAVARRATRPPSIVRSRLHRDRDVVVLQSDAEVVNDWLDRLVAAMRRRAASASSARSPTTRAPPPIRFRTANNPLPPGQTVASLDALFARANPGRSRLRCPRCTGPCLYFRRDCLSVVGAFDAAPLGSDFGVEVDFCLRAGSAGFVHLLAADVFVGHEGRATFGEPRGATSWPAARNSRLASCIRRTPARRPNCSRRIRRGPSRGASISCA